MMFRHYYGKSYILPNVSVEILTSVLQNRTVFSKRAIVKVQRISVIGVLRDHHGKGAGEAERL